MIAPRRNLFGRWSWAKTTSVVINMGVAAFVVACLMSSWSLAQAQNSRPKKSTPPPPAKQDTKTAVQPGSPLDHTKLTKLIDQEVERRLAADKIPASLQIG